jgi:YbgC/YbaW family acyl-CoA thioester hydrolase
MPKRPARFGLRLTSLPDINTFMSTPTALSKQDFRFFHRLRVRWAEVDLQKIVFNAHYLMYLDTAIADYWRALMLPYEAAMHQLQGDLYVKKSGLEFHASARYDDILDIGLTCSRIGNSSMTFVGGIFRGPDLLITGELIYVFADPASQTSRPVPDVLRQVLTDFEANQPVHQFQWGAWSELQPLALPLRLEVFVHEQQVPLEMEQDEWDHEALHTVVTNGMGMPIATGRLVQQAEGVSRIGRMAVTRVLRGGGLGQQVLQALIDVAVRRGDREVVLHAQRHATNFYAQAGFIPHGEPFDEAGIPHIEMRRAL